MISRRGCLFVGQSQWCNFWTEQFLNQSGTWSIRQRSNKRGMIPKSLVREISDTICAITNTYHRSFFKNQNFL